MMGEDGLQVYDQAGGCLLVTRERNCNVCQWKRNRFEFVHVRGNEYLYLITFKELFSLQRGDSPLLSWFRAMNTRQALAELWISNERSSRFGSEFVYRKINKDCEGRRNRMLAGRWGAMGSIHIVWVGYQCIQYLRHMKNSRMIVKRITRMEMSGISVCCWLIRVPEQNDLYRTRWKTSESHSRNTWRVELGM